MALSRKFVDSEGVHWQVYELADDPRRGEHVDGGWLYFFARGETRSLTSYPDDWSAMDWRGLERLCAHARPPAMRDAMGRGRVSVERAEV